MYKIINAFLKENIKNQAGNFISMQKQIIRGPTAVSTHYVMKLETKFLLVTEIILWAIFKFRWVDWPSVMLYHRLRDISVKMKR